MISKSIPQEFEQKQNQVNIYHFDSSFLLNISHLFYYEWIPEVYHNNMKAFLNLLSIFYSIIQMLTL